MQNLQTGVAGGGTFFCLLAQEGGEEEEGKVGVLNCLTAHSEKLHLPASNTLCCYLLLMLPTKALHSFVLDHLWIWVFARVLILRRFTRHQCTLLLPTTHQCCYLWWPTFKPSDWSNHPITGQSDLRTWVSGRTPQYGVTGGSLTDRQAKGWCWSLKPFCRSTWETPTRASNWTRIPPCKISDKNPEFQRISHWIGEDFSLNWRGFVVPAPNHELL